MIDYRKVLRAIIILISGVYIGYTLDVVKHLNFGALYFGLGAVTTWLVIRSLE